MSEFTAGLTEGQRKMVMAMVDHFRARNDEMSEFVRYCEDGKRQGEASGLSPA